MKCCSCGKESRVGVKFPCPKCKKELFRCDRCRQISIDYKCSCGYEGP